MPKFDLYPYKEGDIVTMRKKHPCGSYDFKVLRAGADLRLECTGCGRRLLMKRRKAEKATKSVRPAEKGKEERQ